VKNKKDY